MKVIKENKFCDNSPFCGAKRYCPVSAIKYDFNIKSIIIDDEKCIGCAKCVRACPHNALKMSEE